jgi:predicted Zn-dependent peptidase
MPGAITINASTDTATTVKAVDMALEVLSRFHEQGISSEQLASAKSYYKGIFPSERLETADQIAELIAELELNDLSRSDVDDLFARIDAVTVDDANRVIRTYYQTSGLTFLLLGNAAQFRLEALKYAPAESLVEVPISRPGIQFSPTAGAAIAPTQN